MKKFIIVLSIFLSAFSSFSQEQEQEVTTYYLIRHAEKAQTETSNDDPFLNYEGSIRSLKWAEIFTKVKFEAIYSTDHKRTKKTVRPTADSKNLDVYLYNQKDMYNAVFKNNTEGKNVLIVGHSNTTPFFVNKILGFEKYDQIDENNYSNLYIVTVTKDSRSSILLKID